MSSFSKLTSIVFSEFGESIDQEIVEYYSDGENGNFASASSYHPGNENERRGVLILKMVALCPSRDVD